MAGEICVSTDVPVQVWANGPLHRVGRETGDVDDDDDDYDDADDDFKANIYDFDLPDVGLGRE